MVETSDPVGALTPVGPPVSKGARLCPRYQAAVSCGMRSALTCEGRQLRAKGQLGSVMLAVREGKPQLGAESGVAAHSIP